MTRLQKMICMQSVLICSTKKSFLPCLNMPLIRNTTFLLWIYPRTIKTRYSLAASSTGTKSMLAPHLNSINLSTDLTFSPPYLPPNLPRNVKARGSIKQTSTNREVVLTGPEVKVLFSGCKYDSLVVEDNPQLRQFIEAAHNTMEQIVNLDPAYFKCSAARTPSFEQVIIQPSLNPALYKDKIVFRLATQRTGPDINDQQVVAAFVDADGNDVEPANIKRGGTVVPVFKLCYYKGFMDTYSLQVFLLKGLYTAPPDTSIDNRDWEFDRQ